MRRGRLDHLFLAWKEYNLPGLSLGPTYGLFECKRFRVLKTSIPSEVSVHLGEHVARVRMSK